MKYRNQDIDGIIVRFSYWKITCTTKYVSYSEKKELPKIIFHRLKIVLRMMPLTI